MTNLSTFWPGLGHVALGMRGLGLALAAGTLALYAAVVATLLAPGVGFAGMAVTCLALLGYTVVVTLDAHRRAAAAQSAPPAHDPWFALWLTRLLPPLGFIYLQRIGLGVVAAIGLLVLAGLGASAHPVIAGWLWSAGFGAACWWVFRCASPTPAARRDAAFMAGAVFVVALGGIELGWLVREHVVQAFRMPSESMTPTLQARDYFFAWKSGVVPPGRDDVVVFDYPADPSKSFAKRVVALPGETVEIRDKQLFVDGRAAAEPFAVHVDAAVHDARDDGRDQFGPVVIGADSCFVLGDNRDNSNDSRFFGPVAFTRIRGRAFKIYWPPPRAGAVH